MIIDDDFVTEEYVTVQFIHHQRQYSVTFKKADLEVVNEWVFEEETSLPADLPNELIESIREEIKKKIY
ncbi:hypothetical protein [Neobacillus thermocopriae]|nr:hypothetical protein [Neobacillus thermocopriae]